MAQRTGMSHLHVGDYLQDEHLDVTQFFNNFGPHRNVGYRSVVFELV